MELYIEYIALSKLKGWPRNPKLHSDDLEKSITEFGFVEPIVLDEATGQIVSGHGRVEKLEKLRAEGSPMPANINKAENGQWMAPVVRGVSFESVEAAEKFLLSTNLLAADGGWDELKLEEMLKEIEPFGFKPLSDSELEDLSADGPDIPEEKPEKEPATGEKTESDLARDDLLYGVNILNEDIYFFPADDKFSKDCVGEYPDPSSSSKTPILSLGPNPFGIPNLRPDLLVEELPEKFEVWAGRKSTPDDGETTYLWNYGAVPEEGLPYERSILSFWTHDSFIKPWWIQTAFHVAQYIANGGSMAITPDCSIWDPAPPVLQMLQVYKANWMARWMQETGKMRVIPRLEFFKESAKKFSLSGIPFEAPIVATQMHTAFDKEDTDKIRRNLEIATKLIRCKKLLVYVSDKGRELVEGADLKCDVVMLDTAKKFRAPRDKETREELLKLKESRKDEDPGFISNPDL